MTPLTQIRKTPYNTGFASDGVTCKLGAVCFYSSLVQVDSFLLRFPVRTQSPKTVRKYIKEHWRELGITCIEDEVNWVHSDVRYYFDQRDILVVKP